MARKKKTPKEWVRTTHIEQYVSDRLAGVSSIFLITDRSPSVKDEGQVEEENTLNNAKTLHTRPATPKETKKDFFENAAKRAREFTQIATFFFVLLIFVNLVPAFVSSVREKEMPELCDVLESISGRTRLPALQSLSISLECEISLSKSGGTRETP